MKILLLSVSIGSGHIRAAEAVKAEIYERYPEATVILVDALKYVNPIVDKLVVNGYLKTLKATPIVYKKLYDFADSKENVNELSKLINNFMSKKILKLITEYRPDAIVCTHPFPLQSVSYLKRKGKTSTPLIAILTDFITHKFWIQEKVDAYVVAHEHMKRCLENKGVESNRIYPFGIPVNKDFIVEKDSKDIRREFNLEDKPTYLIMGGGLGIGYISEIFLSLLNSKEDIQIIVITGKNKNLLRTLHELSFQSKTKVLLLSYTNKIADLMSVANVLITKPGGLTISEALIKELPIIVMSPIPGHEEKNARFLVNSGLAGRITEINETEHVLSQIVKNPLRLRHMKEMAKYYAKPEATKDTVDLLECFRREE